jgi:hypothetical protein
MPILTGDERDNVFRLDARHLARDGARTVSAAHDRGDGAHRFGEIAVPSRGIRGLGPASPLNGLSFYLKYGDAIERIAIVGPERWRSETLMFAGADLRRAPVEFFVEGAIAEARAWLTA